MKTDPVSLTKELIDIDSDPYTNGEKEVSKYISEYLGSLGISHKVFEFERNRCDVVASIGSGEGLMLNGHMDTVPIGDASKWRYGTDAKVVNGKLYGRGASDMKGGIGTILSALAGVKANSGKRILLTFVADEERTLKGSTWLLKNRKEAFKGVRYGIVAEPTALKVQVAQKGVMELAIRVNGKSAHSSRPWLGINAIDGMARAIVELQKLSKEMKINDPLLGKGTINVGTIKGGTASNVVPESCEIEVNRRLVNGETPDTAVSEIRKRLDRLGIDYAIKVLHAQMPYKVDQDSKVVKMLRSLVKGDVTIANGYTEAELYARMANMECVVFGPGTKTNIHAPNEYISIGNLEKGTRYFSQIMGKWQKR
ncbi:MAG: M20 family metallopeptidase [Candidatus Micrarchaeota archaeon]|nr:M20 family metallopeptidase [Candidatus Micrarchaeota archaeon]